MFGENGSRQENVIAKAMEWVEEGRGVAIATVLAAIGSSPRPVGSQMAVNDREEFHGSVSGGCIESAVLSEAQFVIRNNQAQRASIGIDSQLAWDYALACGGAIELYIEPVESWRDILVRLSQSIALQHPCCLITDLSTGTKNLYCPELPNQQGAWNEDLRSACDQVIASGQSRLAAIENVDFFLHGFLPPPEVIIGGAVHIAQPLVQMAQLLGYRCSIIDPRSAYATAERFPKANLIVGHPREALKKIPLHTGSAVVALSHSPQLDDPLLAHALEAKAGYIGALGSRRTHAERIRRLLKAGFSNDQLRRIHGPIGLDIGSKTPAEIALSIMAEITQKKRKPDAGQR